MLILQGWSQLVDAASTYIAVRLWFNLQLDYFTQLNNWDEQRENGNFLGVQEKAPEVDDHHH